MIEWTRCLACPTCKGVLDAEAGGPAEEAMTCAGCGHEYWRRDGVFRFLERDGDSPLVQTPDAQEMVRGYRNPNRGLKRIRSLITSEYFPGKTWRRARTAVVQAPGPRLVLGSGACKYPGAIHLDLDDFPGVDVVADAHRLPFRDNSLGGIVCEVVLEHIARPAEVIAEAYRVLRPGGRFFFITPFLFPYHGHPDDYRRWSRQGLKAEFDAFSDIEIGIHAGPCSAMVNLLTEWGYVLSGFTFPRGYVPIKGGLTLLLFPLKFLDRFVNAFPEAHRMAATLFIAGAKGDQT